MNEIDVPSKEVPKTLSRILLYVVVGKTWRESTNVLHCLV